MPLTSVAAAALAAALASPTLHGAHVGIYAVDADSGAVIYRHDARGAFVPASTFKLIVGSTVLARFDSTFAFHTSVERDGEVAGGTLHGDLILRGGGDAHLSASDLDDAAAAVARAGIARVDGAVLVDATRYADEPYPPGWDWDDLPEGYAPVVSAVCLEENTVHLFVSPGERAGDPVTLRITPASRTYAIENDATTGPSGSDDTADVARSWNAPTTIRAIGSYPLGAGESEDLAPAVPDPNAYAGDVFARALAARGVAITQGVKVARHRTRGTAIWTHASAALPQLMQSFWWPSDNLMGEVFLKELGVGAYGEAGSDARGIAVETTWLRSIGVDPRTLTIVDGSGLSSYDRATPMTLVRVLQADWHSAQRATVLDAMPIAGVRGTLQHAFAGTPLQGILQAKTGSMNHTRALAGYVRVPGGKTIAFALMVEDWMDAAPHAAARLDAARAAILEALAGIQ